MDVDVDVTSCTVDMETQDGHLDIQDGGHNKHDSSMPVLLDENNRTLLNGTLASPSQESLPNGPSSLVGAKPNGPISLLSGGVSPSALSSPDTDVLKPADLLRGKSDSFSQKGKSDPHSGASFKSGLQSKNIVISSVNKQSGTIGTKVVTASSQAGKVGLLLIVHV